MAVPSVSQSRPSMQIPRPSVAQSRPSIRTALPPSGRAPFRRPIAPVHSDRAPSLGPRPPSVIQSSPPQRIAVPSVSQSRPSIRTALPPSGHAPFRHPIIPAHADGRPLRQPIAPFHSDRAPSLGPRPPSVIQSSPSLRIAVPSVSQSRPSMQIPRPSVAQSRPSIQTALPPSGHVPPPSSNHPRPSGSQSPPSANRAPPFGPRSRLRATPPSVIQSSPPMQMAVPSREPEPEPALRRPSAAPGAPGEGGLPVRLRLSPDQRRRQDDAIRRHQINTFLSDRISLHRRLPLRWHPLCNEKKYDYRRLPRTSVVIAFYNEARSTLLRTVHSVLETSPDVLLNEVILVDDYSDKGHLKEPLENHLAGLPKVRLIRASKREGLVRARLLGASIATGQVLTFLDCHCECHEGWLEPLLERIREEESAVVCPVIDVIDWNTFEYLGNAGEPQIGGFDWRLVFTWHPIPEREQKRRRSKVDVIRSPTMAGGLFAVSKKYFEYLGSYDTGMEVWGGENLEFSFRIWQCGGSLEIHPCSHVGHVFPKQAPYSRSKALANSVRAAEVWMDGYKELYYHRNPHARLEPYGDVTARRDLRSKLKCRDFKWFLENVYPELHVPEDRPGYFGMLKNKGMENHCFDYNPPDENEVTGQRLILYPCHGMGQNQFFEYTSHHEIRYNTRHPEACAAVDVGTDYVTMYLCQENVPENQKFIFQEDGSLLHVQSQKCLQAEANAYNGNPAPLLRPCTNSDHQKWFFKERA
ncbi:polypeptide N-acetylgalactosaminyltransferase 12 [Ornithorhynchus anatinus]|uniref:polypeptide N-acetylgalactosaminyltransferase 12 n=1 Tax=Ornithorhynchus anatinus TaxID=9258 RepID=UPI0010A89C7D|nr:polypeptide N-acetylgalactosaminyltransferase 12 [Ornithorhynchus anatinus]